MAIAAPLSWLLPLPLDWLIVTMPTPSLNAPGKISPTRAWLLSILCTELLIGFICEGLTVEALKPPLFETAMAAEFCCRLLSPALILMALMPARPLSASSEIVVFEIVVSWIWLSRSSALAAVNVKLIVAAKILVTLH